MPVLTDVESRSRCDLKKRGGRNYWEDPTTEMICCVWCDTDTCDLGVWRQDAPEFERPPRGKIYAAHNGRGFDRFAFARMGWGPIEIDTSELARRAGLPGSLDALAKRWLGLEKDKVSSAFVKSLSRASRAKARAGMLPDLTPEVMARACGYCSSDVEIMASGWELLEPWLDCGWENDVSRAERAINDRGVLLDVQLVKRLLAEDARNADRVLQQSALVLGMSPADVEAIARSPQQFCEFTGAVNAQKETVEWMRDHEEGELKAIASARLALASIARGKLEAAIALVSPDGRLRDSHRYYGAHTGRWSGRGMQLQNMPRPAKRFEGWTDAQICALADAVLAGRHCDADEIDLLLRACLIAPAGRRFVVRDFMGVEARALAWAAGDRRALDVFRGGKLDVYKVAAATIFGVPYEQIGKDERRQVGKVAELACGYGMGPAKFEWTAAKAGSNLEALGVDAAEVVYKWRDLHSPIVRFWGDVQDAFAGAIEGDASEVSGFRFCPSDDGRDVAIFLPSGRPIVYNHVRLGRDSMGRPQLSYEGTKDARERDPDTGERVGTPKPMREKLYGGLITENIIQAACRDLLARAMVTCEDAGLDPVLHVHDELVCEVDDSCADEAEEYLHEVMTDLPEWAEGFPLGADGHSGRRYRK